METRVIVHIKVINSCVECPYYCDEGEFCKSPDRWERIVVIKDVNEPDYCPLQEFGKVVF